MANALLQLDKGTAGVRFLALAHLLSIFGNDPGTAFNCRF